MLAVGSANVNVRQSTGICTAICFAGAVDVEQKRGHRVDITLQLLKLGRRPAIRFGSYKLSQLLKVIHSKKHVATRGEKKGARKCIRCDEITRARGFLAFFPIQHTIRTMELIKVVAAMIADWIRDTLVNVGGRIAEEFIGGRVKRRKRRSNRRRKAGSARSRISKTTPFPEKPTFIHRS